MVPARDNPLRVRESMPCSARRLPRRRCCSEDSQSARRSPTMWPFVMNTRDQAVDDYDAGRFGTIPPDQLAPRNFA
jgi:hypothetical protein